MIRTYHTAEARIDSAPNVYGDLIPLMSIMTGDEKHAEAASSTLDALWILYDRVLRIDPLDPGHEDRDRFFLSKGHGPMAYYAVLAAKGFIDPELLGTFAEFDSALGHHPDRRLIPGVEISSGSLGQGIALGVGTALALSLDGSSARVFVMVGDAELEEGSNHEAIALAGRLELSNLVVIVIDNHSSTHGWPGGISSRFSVEGWHTVNVDGRSHDDMHAGLVVEHRTRPLAVVASIGDADE